MYVFLWLVTGFVFSCGLLALIAITETNSEVRISWVTILILIVGSAGGYITACMFSFFGMMVALEHKPFRRYLTKPFKTIKIKKDKESGQE